MENLKSSFTVALKKREDGSRHFIVMLILMFGFYGLCSMGIGIVSFPYIKQQFIWKSTDFFDEWYATYSSLSSIANVLAVCMLLPLFTNCFRLNDMSITTTCLISFLSSIVITLLAKKNANILYLALVFRMLADMTTIAVRSALTKVVGPNDIGKVSSVFYQIVAKLS